MAGVKWLEAVYGAVTLAAVGGGLALPFLVHHGGSETVPGWSAFVEPGDLSAAHAFLAASCESCHTPHMGPTPAKCIACHAANDELLARETTRFHADVGACNPCHIEHQSTRSRPVAMDHGALAAIAQRRAGDGELPSALAAALRRTLREAQTVPLPHARIANDELALDCTACHANEDPHREHFGADCAHCHATSVWTIPEFRHPSSRSTDCAQCHQAPPSHYMMHFKMVSMTVAGVEHADVPQCFLCHKINAWNDITGVGWYKHH